ncbi:MAG: class I SAM-dependent methyltransferase [Thermoleophilia bacterium]
MTEAEKDISRVQRSVDDARASYDRISRWYDLLEGYWEGKARRQGLSQLAVTAGETVLEVGFGTGLSLVHLARAAGDSGRVLGLDISEGMARMARKRLARKHLPDRVELMVGDFLEYELPVESCDAIFMSFVLELFDTPQIPEVLEKCRYLLKPGGRLGIVSLTKEGPDTAMRRLYELGHEKLPRLLDCRPINVGRALKRAGFTIKSSSRVSIWGLPVEIVLAVKGGP